MHTLVVSYFHLVKSFSSKNLIITRSGSRMRYIASITSLAVSVKPRSACAVPSLVSTSRTGLTRCVARARYRAPSAGALAFPAPRGRQTHHEMRWLFVGEALVLRKDQRILVSLVLKTLAVLRSQSAHWPQSTSRRPRGNRWVILLLRFDRLTM